MKLSLPHNSTPDEAMRWLQQLVRDFGLGFHLDTVPEDYVQPDGQLFFTRDQCTELTVSMERLFSILGNEQPYEIGADVACTLLAESRGLKPPLHYHDPVFQHELLRTGTREQLMAWLCWNDPNGIYTDEASLAEDRPPLTLAKSRQIMREQIERD